jgi:tol-pal system protein YbgF
MKDQDDGPMPPATPPANTDARMTELQTSLTELLERIDVLNDRMTRLEEGRSAGDQRPAPVVVPAPVAAPQQAAPAPAAAIEQQPAPAQGALHNAQIADSYRNALMLYGRGKMADARRAFQAVFDAEPNGELSDNALYWIGETYFAASDWSNAMRFYERVVQEFPEQNKAPDALYKIGMTHEKTSDLALARAAFEELIKRYPYSTPAASAKLELKRIKY